jgi:uncharacterized protein YuzE
MASSDLTASEIETPLQGEPAFLVSARIYDSATNSPDAFKAVVAQLDQDAKAGTASGVKVDYDTQGKVSAITINKMTAHVKKQAESCAHEERDSHQQQSKEPQRPYRSKGG